MIENIEKRGIALNHLGHACQICLRNGQIRIFHQQVSILYLTYLDAEINE